MEKLDWILEIIRELEAFARSSGDVALLRKIKAAKVAYTAELRQKRVGENLQISLGPKIISEP